MDVNFEKCLMFMEVSWTKRKLAVSLNTTQELAKHENKIALLCSSGLSAYIPLDEVFEGKKFDINPTCIPQAGKRDDVKGQARCVFHKNVMNVWSEELKFAGRTWRFSITRTLNKDLNEFTMQATIYKNG